MRRAIWIVAVVVSGVVITWAATRHTAQAPLKYRTSKVLRGDMETVVSATGMVRAVTLVPVGSQVSGRIKEILVDYNSLVTKGQTVALIEPDLFQGKVDVAQANLEASKAAAATGLAEMESKRAQVRNMRYKLEQARAFVEKCEVTVEDTRKTLERQKSLFRKGMIPESTLDSVTTAYNSALAQKREALASLSSNEAQLEAARIEVKVAQARYQTALARVRQAEATLKTAEIDLGHTVIYSPVEGIVISRDVDVGQTVAASLQAPTLFTIAEDLSIMQVIASVDEADIGGIQEGQTATFTVDAYPDRTFEGRAIQVRNMPRESQNVVTYDVIIEVSNSDFKLKPGMTANVNIIKASRQDVLKVPAAALRFKPSAAADGNKDEADKSRTQRSGRKLEKIQQTLTAKLQLTQEQQEQLSRILNAGRQKFLALPEGRGRESKIKQIRADSRRKIRNILTEEQKSRYDNLTAAWDARRKAARKGGLKAAVWTLSEQDGPMRVPVLLGIFDGSYYELISGKLKERQEVVIGVAYDQKQRKKNSVPPGFGFRRFR